MERRNAENSYNTNLASEYLIMSLLSRVGKDAYLSLGNKKGVDIIVKTQKGSICIIEVKGVNKKDDWIICNSGKFPNLPNLFYALVCFNGKIKELTDVPDFYLIPAFILAEITEHKIAKNKKTVFISNKRIREKYTEYLNTFTWLDNFLGEN